VKNGNRENKPAAWKCCGFYFSVNRKKSICGLQKKFAIFAPDVRRIYINRKFNVLKSNYKPNEIHFSPSLKFLAPKSRLA
jgi:hypothetical protein